MAPSRNHESEFSTSIHLLKGIASTDAIAWARFTHLYEGLFRHWYRRCNVAEQDWSDLSQEIFLAVAKGLPTYEHQPTRGAFRGWLRVIARNKIADLFRKQLPRPVTDVFFDRMAATTEPDEFVVEDSALLQRALNLIRTDFESATWQAFWLVAVEGRTPSAVAAELSVSINAVYLAKSRVMRRLRAEFAELLDLPPASPGEP